MAAKVAPCRRERNPARDLGSAPPTVLHGVPDHKLIRALGTDRRGDDGLSPPDEVRYPTRVKGVFPREDAHIELW